MLKKDVQRCILALSSLVVILSAISSFIPEGNALLLLDREKVMAGQWWRLISGHFTHLSVGHWSINLVALSILGWLAVQTNLLVYLAQNSVIISIPFVPEGTGFASEDCGMQCKAQNVDGSLTPSRLCNAAMRPQDRSQDSIFRYEGYITATSLRPKTSLCILLGIKLLLLALGCSLLLLWLAPELSWYGGLSGLLYGCFSFGSLYLALQRGRLAWLAWIISGYYVSEMSYSSPLTIPHQVIAIEWVPLAHTCGWLVGSTLALSNSRWIDQSIKELKQRFFNRRKNP